MNKTQMSELSVEEAITHIKAACKIAINAGYNSVVVDACAMAVAALRNEPCEDAISRQAVLEAIRKCHCEEWIKADIGAPIEALSPVTPAEKVGRWITWKEAGNEIPSETRFECSVCHDAAQTLVNGLDLLSPYCPNCGAKMEDGEI